MESSLPMVKPIALMRPRGAHRFEEFNAMPQCRLTFYKCSSREVGMVHETGSAVIRLCKRLGYMRIDGSPRLLGFFGWRIDNNKLGIHTDNASSDGNEESSRRPLDVLYVIGPSN